MYLARSRRAICTNGKYLVIEVAKDRRQMTATQVVERAKRDAGDEDIVSFAFDSRPQEIQLLCPRSLWNILIKEHGFRQLSGEFPPECIHEDDMRDYEGWSDPDWDLDDDY